MVSRKGMGLGKGQGFYNIIPQDSVTHSMNAKGVSTRSNWRSFDGMSMTKKRGLIKEIARKASDGIKWAIEWEKEHLPGQEAWVKKEYQDTKKLLSGLALGIKLSAQQQKQLKDDLKSGLGIFEIIDNLKKGVDFKKAPQKEQEKMIKDIKLEVERQRNFSIELAKKRDIDDVRDEIDHDDDGIPDITVEDLENVNKDIKSELNTIDLDNSGIPDPIEDGTFQFELEEEEPPEPPYPTFKTKVKEAERKFGGFLRESSEKAITALQSEIKRRQLESDFIRALPEKRLSELALQEPNDFLSGTNKYERELIRRSREKIKLNESIKRAQEDQLRIEESKKLRKPLFSFGIQR